MKKEDQPDKRVKPITVKQIEGVLSRLDEIVGSVTGTLNAIKDARPLTQGVKFDGVGKADRGLALMEEFAADLERAFKLKRFI